MYDSMRRADQIAVPILSRLSAIFAAANAGPVPDDLVQAVNQAIVVNRWPHGDAPEYNALIGGDTPLDQMPNLTRGAGWQFARGSRSIRDNFDPTSHQS